MAHAGRLYLTVFFAACLSWSAVDAQDYAYPYRDPYLATVTAAILNTDGLTPRLKRQVVRMPGLPGRNDLPTLRGRGDLTATLYRQNRPAPVLFVLSGIGSTPYFGLATYLAALFHAEGSHVVILPSPMSWNFALAASRSGAPGYAPEDARDLYDVMQKTLAVLTARHGLKITRINFLGVSLGALEGAFLSVIDAEEQKIGIAKYLLINPPLDLGYALKKVDEWDALGAKFGRGQSEALVGRAMGIVETFSKERRDDPIVLERFAKAFTGSTTEELQYLIAEDLFLMLPELVYVTQVIHDQNVLTAPKDQIRARLAEAKTLTFRNYSEKIALPLWRLQMAQPQADLETFTRQGSFTAVLDRLRGNPRVHVMHNADDFVADRKSIEALKAALGDQMTLYPHGGHLGNLSYPDNRERVLQFFRAPR